MPPNNEQPPPADVGRPVALTAGFRFVFVCVFLLTLILLALSVYLAGLSEPSENAKKLFAACTTSWQMGFGAMVGLIGGKSL